MLSADFRNTAVSRRDGHDDRISFVTEESRDVIDIIRHYLLNIATDDLIISFNFINPNLESCIYYKRDKNGRTMVLGLYVDDFLIVLHNDRKPHHKIIKLEERFSIKMLDK